VPKYVCPSGRPKVGIEAKVFDKDRIEVEVTELRGDCANAASARRRSLDAGLDRSGLGFRAKGPRRGDGVAGMYAGATNSRAGASPSNAVG